MKANLMKRLFVGIAAFGALASFSIAQPAYAQTLSLIHI